MARFCSNCGGSVEPGQKFCMNCGAPVIEATRAPGQEEPRQKQENAAGFGCATPQPPTQVITNGSPLARAWNDVRTQKGLLGRLVVLALLTCVPILNFVVFGYCLMWCADSALGRNQEMPNKYVSGPLFTLGFFSFVYSLAWGVVFGVLSCIPLVGLLASIAFLVVCPCLILGQVRLALFGSLGSAFELSKIWDLFRSNMGSTLVITWAPQAIALAVSLVISVVLGMFGGAGALTAFYAGSHVVAAGIGALGAGLATVVSLVLISFVEVTATLITCRAFGYFVAETAPQWVRDGLVANPQARV